jgi:hypothetical protein
MLDLDAILRGLGQEPAAADLTQSIREFVDDPAGYCDPSWLPEPLVILRGGRPVTTPLARACLSAWLLRQAGGTGGREVVMDDPIRRVALLPVSVLERTIQVLGLLSFGEPLRHLLDRQRAARIQGLFGRDAYLHALRLCAHFRPQNDTASLQDHGEDELRDAIRRCGFLALRWTVAGPDAEIAARLTLKFDRGLGGPPRHGGRLRLFPTGAPVGDHLVPLVLALDPSWDYLF